MLLLRYKSKKASSQFIYLNVDSDFKSVTADRMFVKRTQQFNSTNIHGTKDRARIIKGTTDKQKITHLLLRARKIVITGKKKTLEQTKSTISILRSEEAAYVPQKTTQHG